MFVLVVLQEAASFDRFASPALLKAELQSVPPVVAGIAGVLRAGQEVLHMRLGAHRAALRTPEVAAPVGLHTAAVVPVVPQELLVVAHTVLAVAPVPVVLVARTGAELVPVVAQEHTELAPVAGGALQVVMVGLPV